jgi:putative mRNA 3-end processing factor
MRAVPDRFEVERAGHGLRVRDYQLYLDPLGRPPLGFLAHARGAGRILPERTVASGPTIALLQAAQPLSLRKAAALPAAFGQPFALGALRLTLYPAGHVLGSAQLRCEGIGVDLVYTGDLGHDSLTAGPRQQLQCDTLVLRATYGHPRYVFPPREQLLERAAAFVEETLSRGETPLFIAAAVGATQELARYLGDLGRTLRLHPTSLRACEVYVKQGVPLKNLAPLSGEGHAIVVPPTARLDRLPLAKGRPLRRCVLSGRALDGRGELPLSDHAGFPQLVEYALAAEARRVLTVHGHADDLARELRDRGLDAHAIREHQHQLALPGIV